MTKKGSGRTKGATSCVLVPLHRIVERFGDVEVAVPYSKILVRGKYTIRCKHRYSFRI